LNRGRVSDIDVDCTGPGQLCGQMLRRFEVDIGDDDLCACARQLTGGGSSNSTCATRDECNLSIQTEGFGRLQRSRCLNHIEILPP